MSEMDDRLKGELLQLDVADQIEEVIEQAGDGARGVPRIDVRARPHRIDFGGAFVVGMSVVQLPRLAVKSDTWPMSGR